MAKDELTVLEGNLSAAGLKIAVVCARFNEFFVSKLFSGAVDAIVRHGGSRANITQAWVPEGIKRGMLSHPSIIWFILDSA